VREELVKHDIVPERAATRDYGTDLCVVCLGASDLGDATSLLQDLLRSRSRHELIVVAKLDAGVARVVLASECKAVIWWPEDAHILPRTVLTAHKCRLRTRVCDVLKAPMSRDRRLASLAHIVTSEPQTCRRVAALAKAIHCSEPTLRAAWQRAGLPDSPHMLVTWGRLLAVFESKNLTAAQGLTGVHEATLRRAVKKIFGAQDILYTDEMLLHALKRWVGKADDVA